MSKKLFFNLKELGIIRYKKRGRGRCILIGIGRGKRESISNERVCRV